MLRVPFVVWGPGVAAGRIDSPVSIADVLPTVLEALALPPETGIAGRSLWPMLRRRAAAGTPIAPRPQPLTRLDAAARYRVRLVNAGEVPRLSRATPVLAGEAVEAPGAWLTGHGLTLPWSFPETMWVIEGERR